MFRSCRVTFSIDGRPRFCIVVTDKPIAVHVEEIKLGVKVAANSGVYGTVISIKSRKLFVVVKPEDIEVGAKYSVCFDLQGSK